MFGLILASSLCATALAGPFKEANHSEAPGVCRLVEKTALEVGVDPAVAISEAFHETRFKNLPSHYGRRLLAEGVAVDDLPANVERTAMQCKPAHYCPGGTTKDCDFLTECMRHLKRQLDHPRRCRKAAQVVGYRTLWLPVIEMRTKCWRVQNATPDERLMLAFARYKHPYGVGDGYGARVWRRYDRLRRALRRRASR